MRDEQLELFPLYTRYALPDDVANTLRNNIVSIGQTASDNTLKMTFLDPDHTRSQTIGTYLWGNFTSRLEAAYINNENSPIKATLRGRQFRLRVDSANGVSYSFPIHRCVNYIPRGGAKLKADVRAKERQSSLMRQQPPGLFIGVTYHEEKGLIEIFVGQLFPDGAKKYHTAILAILYSKNTDTVEKDKLQDRQAEEIADPVVKLKAK